MAIELIGYRGWHGELQSPWKTCWPIVRTSLMLVLRRKIFWLLLGLGLVHFLFSFALIYVKAQLAVQMPQFAGFLDRIQVTGTGKAYLEFMFGQGIVTMLLLAFAGSMLVGSDYHQAGLTFYLSRRIGRPHYVAGKLLAIATLVTLITTVPALVLYFEYGMLSSSLEYFRENPRILLGILGYGTISALVLSLLLAALAAWVPRTAPLVMSWTCIFLLLPILSESLRHIRDNRMWRLLNLRYDLRVLGSWCFGSLREDRDEVQLAFWAAWIVLALCLGCLAAFLYRARAVEVVR
jgi:hypothetical protein